MKSVNKTLNRIRRMEARYDERNYGPMNYHKFYGRIVLPQNRYRKNHFLPSLWNGSHGTGWDQHKFEKEKGFIEEQNKEAINENLDLLEEKPDESQVKFAEY